MPLSAQMAITYAARIPKVLQAVELLGEADLLTEMNAIGRIIVESCFKLAFILQEKPVGAPPVDRTLEDRELCAYEVWDHERLLDIKVLRLVEQTRPMTVDPSFLAALTKVEAQLLKKVGKKKDNRFEQAGAAGMEADYRLFFGPMSQDAHATINAARRSTKQPNPDVKRATVLTITRSAIMFLAAASQLLDDTPGIAAAESLRLRLAEL